MIALRTLLHIEIDQFRLEGKFVWQTKPLVFENTKFCSHLILLKFGPHEYRGNVLKSHKLKFLFFISVVTGKKEYILQLVNGDYKVYTSFSALADSPNTNTDFQVKNKGHHFRCTFLFLCVNKRHLTTLTDFSVKNRGRHLRCTGYDVHFYFWP